MPRTQFPRFFVVALAVVALSGVACGKKKPPVATPAAPPSNQPAFPGAVRPATNSPTTTVPPAPPDPAMGTVTTPSNPVTMADPLVTMTPEQINQQSPLKPVFFALDSEDVDDAGRKTLGENSEVLKRYPTWVITIEGHSDERGTAEYNLSLGDRRALAAKNYLLSLGVPADRVRTVSYGKEFPFDPGHDEAAWTKNRRAHFMVTATGK